MENEIKLVNEVKGSVVSDNMMSTLDTGARNMAEAGRRIGQLEGELKVAEQLIAQEIVDSERRIENASERVSMTIHVDSKAIYDDYYSHTMKNPSSIQHISIDKANLNDLADATVKAQAIKDTEEAEKKVEDAKNKMDLMEKTCKRNEERANKMVKEAEKTKKDAIEKAVDNAERQNTRAIAEHKLTIKGLEKEADLLVDEKSNLAKERDLSLEAQSHKIRLLENAIEILKRTPQSILDSIKNRTSYWFYNRKITRLES